MTTTKGLLFNGWELQYLQATLNRWHDYKGHGLGGGTFSDAERLLVETIRHKVQVVDGTPITFTSEEKYFLEKILYDGKQNYGRGGGNAVFESTRTQVQQRTVFLNSSILAKLQGWPAPIVNPGETEALES